MGEAEKKGAGREPPDAPHAVLPMHAIESGGEIQPGGLADRGKIVIERTCITVEGTTPTIVLGIAVTGTVGCALVAVQPDGLLPGLAAMGTITILTGIYFRSAERAGARPVRIRPARLRTGRPEPPPPPRVDAGHRKKRRQG